MHIKASFMSVISDKVATSVMSVTSWIAIKLYLASVWTSVTNVFDEFVENQLLDHNDIPQSLWEMAEEKMEDSNSVFVRMDVLWGYLGSVKTGDGCELKF